ncbi:MAG: hypothetical protein R2932_48665 [Caldilineaceae bacterium]
MKPHRHFIDFSRWQCACWVTDRRYYVAEVKQDIFGAWVLERTWGSRFSQRGNHSTVLAQNYDHALVLMGEVAKRRIARKYMKI